MCLYRTVNTCVPVDLSVFQCVVSVFTSGPGCHVCHLLKSIQEGSGNHDGCPESKTNTTHQYINPLNRNRKEVLDLIWICTSLGGTNSSSGESDFTSIFITYMIHSTKQICYLGVLMGCLRWGWYIMSFIKIQASAQTSDDKNPSSGLIL